MFEQDWLPIDVGQNAMERQRKYKGENDNLLNISLYKNLDF